MIDKVIASSGMLPNACWKTLGKVMKSKLGPASGLIPTEKAAGKMIIPAKIATNVSIVATLRATLGSGVSFLNYEA